MSNRALWVGGNWKCNGSIALIDTLTDAINQVEYNPEKVDVVVCPAAVHLEQVKKKLKNSCKVCAQNISKTGNGAYTGEVSSTMLADIGIESTLIGHSERRQYYGETDEDVAKKLERAQEAGLNAIICIGETLEQREANETENVCKKQIKAFINQVKDFTKIVIAYEPIWAIGTGKVASPQQAQDAHEKIRDFIKENTNEAISSRLRIVYGGSVTPDNCKSLIKEKDIDGFLVGGASLKPTFTNIIQACAEA